MNARRDEVTETTYYEVEWCTGAESDGAGGHDPETCDWRIKDFSTLTGAIAYAKKVLPNDYYGCVRVTPWTREPYEPGRPGWFKEYGESIDIDSDSP